MPILLEVGGPVVASWPGHGLGGFAAFLAAVGRNAYAECRGEAV
jgi:hypothetical protein